MGQPGGIPGGGIASLAPQVGGQLGGFGQMMNQAVAPQPTMLGFSQAGRPPGGAENEILRQQPLSPQMPGYMQQQAHQQAQQRMGQPSMGQPSMGQPSMGQPGMGQRSIGDMSFFQPPQQGGFAPPVGGQPGMGQMPPGMAQRQQPFTAANDLDINQYNLMRSQAQGPFGAPGAPGMGPPGMQRRGIGGIGGIGGLASMMGGFRR